MANKASRKAGRTLIVFALAVLAMYGGLAFNGSWTPRLGLDLQGGTRITLEASTETGEEITPEKLEEAAGIIDARVNGTGVAESEVTTQGESNIIVEIPGENRKDLVDLVKQTAQLRFRLVAASAPGTPQPDAPAPSPSEEPSPARPTPRRAATRTAPNRPRQPRPAGRAVSEGLVRADETPAPDEQPAPDQAPAPNDTQIPTNESSVDELLAWMRAPDQRSVQRFQEFVCTDDQRDSDNPAKPILACDEFGNKYLLSPAMIEGTQLDDADYGIPQNDVQYVVNLDFDGEATRVFADVTRADQRHRRALRDRARRRGALRAAGHLGDHGRQRPDHRRLHRRRGTVAGEQPQVRRAPADVRRLGRERGGADPGRRPAVGGAVGRWHRARSRAALRTALLPRARRSW